MLVKSRRGGAEMWDFKKEVVGGTNLGKKDMRKRTGAVVLDDLPSDDKTMRCMCDGKHVCGGCLKRESNYYKETE